MLPFTRRKSVPKRLATLAALSALVASPLLVSGVTQAVAAAPKPIVAPERLASSTMNLRAGDTGPAVSALQQKLGLTPTGTFDQLTTTGLRQWQLEHGVAGTGTLDAATRAGLAQTPATVGTRPAGVLPASAAGWKRLYSEDFLTPADRGSFVNSNPNDWYLQSSHPYSRSLRSYPDGWGTTGNVSYNWASRTANVSSTASNAPGVFRVWGHTESIGGTNKSLAGAFFPVIRPDAATNQAQTAQTFGRYSVRFRTYGGYPSSGSGARYGSAFLLWPANDNWAEGEVDFPEMAWGGKINGYVHQMGQPWNNAHVISTQTPTDNTWHTATIEWYPTALAFYLDGVRVSKVTTNVPQTPFRWGFQSGGHDGTPASTVTGSLQIDWITIDAYDGATPPR
ncbi:MAG: hypothetical protein JWP61_568 [Friedmanniella sp.]|nr:hypothetical protein [Friedmanniella sp.]